MHRITLPLALLLGVTLIVTRVAPLWAHQPYFEATDTTAAAPWRLADPTVSVALYFTLDRDTDVDYATFEGAAGQVVLVGLSIPQIEGQENFTPQVAVLGPDLSGGQLPAAVTVPAGSGAYRLAPVEGEAPIFFEPFSRTRYYRRQQERITLPTDGRYVIAVWSDQGAVGRYTLVVGDREIFGGDPAFGAKIGRYWQPVATPVPTATPLPPTPTTVSNHHPHCRED